MKIGVVSDTHNNLKNIEIIVSLFNREDVQLVIHTGDITNHVSLQKFSELNCNFCGVYGNNDRNEIGLKEYVEENGLKFKEPPFLIHESKRNIAIFHEPDSIDDFLSANLNIDIVLHGHTHRYRKDIQNDTLIYNPGESAGMLSGKNAIGIINLENLYARRIFF